MTVITLPFPVSVNGLFADGKTRRHKSQRYCDWLIDAGYALNLQRPPKIKGQVILHYLLQEGIDNRRRDLGNYEKCVTDLLVSHGVIEADDGRIVREITLRWSRAGQGIQITIISVQEEDFVPRTSIAS
ncbi:RusA family crossover junction endodeoxyribonuclease [Bradyrhizobium sp. Leo121]|uniref:RusA family crossover junction endodeoxyribonuclease n=1 Tax=Bradyrhizobium sp. Leo121 TaxID=1571195 RepID=UPI0013EF43C0|nr:RusA family crossover junction endodeoxyribonuclease [Bradyrhizobium sp. Leo121]